MTATEVAELKGEKLDDALKAAGLGLTGTAEEKRSRLAGSLPDPPQSFDTFAAIEETMRPEGAGIRVALAGLLAHDPSLSGAELEPDEWRELLDKYLKSERP